MSAQVGPVRDFVLKWLNRRARDPREKADALALIQSLPPLLGGVPAGLTIADRFVGLIEVRLSAVVELSRRWRGEVGSGAASPADSWRKEARRIQSEWHRDDPDSWGPDLLEIIEAGNRLAVAIVSTSLDDALDSTLTAKPALAALRRLRAVDESHFSELTVPPNPDAPWDASAYLIPPEFSEVFSTIERVIAGFESIALDRGSGATWAAGLDEVVRGWGRLALAYDAGRPVAKGQVLAIFNAIHDLGHTIPPDLSRSFDEAGRALGGEGRRVPSRTPTSEDRIPSADRQLAELVAILDRDGSPEARTFGRRVGEILSASGRDRARLLLGGLIHLDQIGAEPGRVQEWVRIGRSPLLELARTLEDCEVIDEELVGRPIRQVADYVTCVRVDDQARPGASHRVTRVERPGYALRLPDGDRQILAQAQVWVSP